jgi:hypothetical protein
MVRKPQVNKDRDSGKSGLVQGYPLVACANGHKKFKRYCQLSISAIKKITQFNPILYAPYLI